MAIADQTLTRIQSLARLYQSGYSSKTVDATIAKLVDMERSRLQAEADNLLEQMRKFEAEHGLASAEFHRRFQVGELGDDADLFGWSALYFRPCGVSRDASTYTFINDGTMLRTIRPGLAGFPDHVHVERESRVEPGSAMSIIALIQLIEAEFSA